MKLLAFLGWPLQPSQSFPPSHISHDMGTYSFPSIGVPDSFRLYILTVFDEGKRRPVSIPGWTNGVLFVNCIWMGLDNGARRG
jgi:hypothetical protein